MLKLLDILKAAVAKGASDVHLVVGRPPLIRVGGEIVPLDGAQTVTRDESRRLIYSVLYEYQRTRFEDAWELDCSLNVPDVSRFRVNVYRQRKGLGAVLRVIPSKIPTPEQIGLPPAVIRTTREARGFVLVTGPTNSGKSTTMASLVQAINAAQRKTVLTVEDPIEFVHRDAKSIVIQREVGQHTKSFAEALRHAMRQDPDVIMIGEMRDLETISLAMTAAETGHLCFATLHTQDAPTSIDRIVDVYAPEQQQQARVQLSMVLKAVVSQTLLPRLDGKGRVCAREVMVATPAVRNLIRQGKIHMLHGVIESSARSGMITMDQHLAHLVKNGVVSRDEALAKARDPHNLIQLLAIRKHA
ncbi:MAG: type IV pilus twitching motility protein PilT [Elusimicrobiota bacterium]